MKKLDLFELAFMIGFLVLSVSFSCLITSITIKILSQ